MAELVLHLLCDWSCHLHAQFMSPNSTTFTKTVSTALGHLSRIALSLIYVFYTTHHHQSPRCHLLTPLRVVRSKILLTCRYHFHHAGVRNRLGSNVGRRHKTSALTSEPLHVRNKSEITLTFFRLIYSKPACTVYCTFSFME